MNAGERVIQAEDWTTATKKEVKRLGRRHLKNLERQGQAGSCASRHGRTYWALSSFAGRFCALLLSYPKGAPPLSMAQLKAKAELITTRVHSGEPVWFDAVQKPDGSARPVSRHGVLARAATCLAGHVCQVAMGGPSPYEYSRRGRGRDRMIGGALHSFRNGGVRWFVVADVRKFHPSFNKKAVENLIPLPRSVIQNSLCLPDDALIKFSPTYPLSAPTSPKAVLAGLPMGLSTSVLVASKLIQPVLAQLSCRFVACHGDNILIGVRTEEEADAVMHALASLLEKHPAGPFKLNYLEKFKPEKEIDVLGYRFRYASGYDGGYARVVPSREAIKRCQRKLAYQLILTPQSGCSAMIESRLAGWCGSYGQWRGRAHGVDIAVVEFCNHVLPRVDLARMMLKGMTFKGNLSGIKEAFDEVWAMLENAHDEMHKPTKKSVGIAGLKPSS